MQLQRIVVGIDGSSPAHHALEWAASIAAATGAEVVAVHAVGMLAHLDEGDDEHVVPASSHRAELEEAVRRWCAPLEASPAPHRTLLVDGPAENVLRRVADDEDADLIVMGSRGLGATPAGRLGSTSLRVTELAKRPVLVVPERVPEPVPDPPVGEGTGG